MVSQKAVKQILLNPMQLMLELATQKTRVVQVGRGGGKSTGAALDIKNVVYDMPRSKNFILGETYQQILTRTLPSTIKALDMIGFKKNLHYFIGRQAPRNWKWKEAYEPPGDFKHSIQFYNGTVYDLLSQEANSRGANYSSGMLDEAQDIDSGKFQSQVIPTMRGEYARFGKHRTYRRLSMYCSMPRIRKAEWIFEYEELAKKLSKEYLWITGPSKLNAHNLPPEWFTDQKRILLPSEYDIEIENIRPKKIIGGFYPFFDDKIHSYTSFNNEFLSSLIDDKSGYNVDAFENLDSRQDGDVDHFQPLDISMDYGAWFNGIVTGQEKDARNYQFLSAMSIDQNSKFEDLLDKWAHYYRFHCDKRVYYYYDHTAKGTDPRVEEYYKIVCRVLRGYGWHVIEMDIGQQPGHDDRYKFWGYAHKGDHPMLPRFWYNRHHCNWLIQSLNGADLIQGRNGFEKKKVDEKNHAIDQRTTTHFSDAHDTLAVGKYGALTMIGGISIARPRLGR